ncbi:MAG: AzlD domain-containing protein [Gammaproteobacteria bacterium]|nr:AzlD domain-containing protein [Gammaproteobacteria bacterium]
MSPELLSILGLCGFATLCLKGSFIEGQRHLQMPGWFRDALDYVPPAILMALVVPGFIKGDATLTVLNGAVWIDPRWIGAIVAFAAYQLTRKSIPTLAAGMLALHGSYWLQSVLTAA